jgi:hypothetical protein
MEIECNFQCAPLHFGVRAAQRRHQKTAMRMWKIKRASSGPYWIEWEVLFMHRANRPRLRSLFLACTLGLSTWASAAQPLAQTLELAGAKFEPQVQLGGTALKLNGAAIRSKVIFKVYAVGLYLPLKAGTVSAVMNQPGPKRVHAVMLRDISGAELGKNFTHHFQDNASREEFAGSINHIFRFGELFSSRKLMKAGESFTLDWVPGLGTVLSINGVQQGEPYPGEAFYSGMLKLWIGDRDSAGVREALLGHTPGSR